jgi:hypothetical protein
MLSRTRRASQAHGRAAPARSRFGLEPLESRTLLSGSVDSFAAAMFNTTYAALQIRPATVTAAERETQAAGPAPVLAAQFETAAPVDSVIAPEFTGPATVVVDPDGTSGTIVDYRASEPGSYAAAARWDGGDAEPIVLDQPGEFGHEPGTGAVYAQRVDLAPGLHTLELTVTHIDSGASATTSASFDVPETAEAPAPAQPVVYNPAESPFQPDASFTEAGTAESALTASTGPAVTAVYVDSTAWAPGFRSYLAANNYGDAGYKVPDGAAQLMYLPWTNINRVSVRFSEDVTVARADLMLSGVAVTTYGYAAGGFSYDPATFTATWTLDRNVPADKLRLQLRDAVHNGAGTALDGDWADGADAYSSGDGAAGGAFNFRVNICPGDVNQSGATNSNDEIDVRNRFFTSTTTPWVDPAYPYTPLHDVNGSGQIDASDFSDTRKGSNAPPPPADEPLAPLDPDVPLDGAPRSRTQYIPDDWGDSVKLRLDTRVYGTPGESLADVTFDPVRGPGPLTYSLIGQAKNGGVELTPTDGNWTYTPLFDRLGPDHFRYNVSDGDAVGHPADVFIETTREVIFANDDWYSPGGTADPVNSPWSVLANDFGSPIRSMPSLTVSGGGTTARGGSVTLQPNGDFQYTPPQRRADRPRYVPVHAT